MRNGHALASAYCDDQFTSASDDELFAWYDARVPELAAAKHAITLRRGSVAIDLHSGIFQPGRMRLDWRAFTERQDTATPEGFGSLADKLRSALDPRKK